MAMTIGSTRQAISNVNVTPLIDVLLVLLIIFMVIAPADTVGLHAAIPKDSATDPEPVGPDPTVVISIDKHLVFSINSEPTTVAQLGSRLAEIFKIRARRVVFVKADDGVEFRHVAQAIDIAKSVGIDTVGLLGGRL